MRCHVFTQKRSSLFCAAIFFVAALGASAQSQISVPGMSKYTDSGFGFSFWYPHFVEDSYQMVLHRPVETATVCGKFDSLNAQVSDSLVVLKIQGGRCDPQPWNHRDQEWDNGVRIEAESNDDQCCLSGPKKSTPPRGCFGVACCAEHDCPAEYKRGGATIYCPHVPDGSGRTPVI